jgi:formylglycine-generating enzyme required for sulfatase activity
MGTRVAADPITDITMGPRFFQVVGPTATTITAFTPDGYITWTNAQVGTNYTVQTARRLGAATNWVDYVQIPVSNNVVTHRLCDPNPPPGMVLIPAGSFTMGDCMGDGVSGDELPLHTVCVSAFYMEKYLVTSNLWLTVTAWNGGNGYSYETNAGSYGTNAGSGKASGHPVVWVRWYDVVKWCNARSEKEGLTPCYYTNAELTTVYKTERVAPYVNWSANGYRLPTEAEWEKAARGGASGHRFPWSDADTIDWSRANYPADPRRYSYDVNPTSGFHPTFYDGVSPFTSPVGYFAPNGYGLYDMAGNVCEWCWDWYDGSWYSNAGATQSDTRGPASSPYGARVDRGGSHNIEAGGIRCAFRLYCAPPQYANYNYGFRCVRGL